MRAELLGEWSLVLAAQPVGIYYLKRRNSTPGMFGAVDLATCAAPLHQGEQFDVSEFDQLRVGVESSGAASGGGTLTAGLADWEGLVQARLVAAGYAFTAPAGCGALLYGPTLPDFSSAPWTTHPGRAVWANPGFQVTVGPVTWTGKLRLWGLR